jgi:hypothetical protein
MRLEFLTPGDAKWQAFLQEVPHDFYHLPAYVQLEAEHEGGEAEAVLASTGSSYFFLPYTVRRLDAVASLEGHAEGLCDICSPYGYPGPLALEASPGFLQAAVGAWVAALRERQVVSGFVRLHPLLPTPLEALQPFGSLVARGRTVSIDLTISDEECWRQMRRNHRKNIEQALKLGLTATMDQGREALQDFQVIYHETMDRVAADNYYFFAPSYFARLSDALGEALWICRVRGPDQATISVGLLVECAGIVQYHLGGTRTESLHWYPSKLLFNHAWRWAKARGQRVLHLGGGVGGAEDALFNFKVGFSDRRHPFYTWQLIFLDQAYESLENRRRQSGPPQMRAGFFPAYRA